MPLLVRNRAPALLCLLTAAALAGCTDTGYRTEVYTGSNGTYQIKRVPEPPAPPPQSYARQSATTQVYTKTEIVVVRPTTDPDLTDVENMWPNLSEGDRQTVRSLVHRLCGQ